MKPLVLGLAVASAGLLLAACGKDEPPKDTTPPVLSQPMIDLAHVVEFLPFGATLSGSGVLNPTYEFRTDTPAMDVVAVSAGVVVAIRGDAITDAEVEIRPTANSVYAIIYDHVRALTVGVGANVTPGTVLGWVGPWSMSQGRTELQVNRDGSPTLAHCPEQFGTTAFNEAHAAAMAAVGSGPVCVADTVVP